MSKRDELVATAVALGERLGVAVETNRSNSELARVIEELQTSASARGQVEVRQEETPIDLLRGGVDSVPAGTAAAVGGPPQYAYTVAQGCTVVCRRGKLVHGSEIRPADVGGAAELDRMVAAGSVQRGPLARPQSPVLSRR